MVAHTGTCNLSLILAIKDHSSSAGSLATLYMKASHNDSHMNQHLNERTNVHKEYE